ncbi:MAG: GLPGLI family protein [Dinghuibacter sp.]|nr:GLPGLI family protein [Dinghuibacter sp.]
MKKITLFIALLLVQNTFFAQVQLLSYGHIEYERRTNQHKLIDALGMEKSMTDEVKKTASKVLVDKFLLRFSGNYSDYRLTGTNEHNQYFALPAPSAEDFVQKDLGKQRLHFRKDLLGNVLVVNDSLQNFKWKILPEIRIIAGFECKKAVAVMYDSVYVVAFFTTDIIHSSGPEIFCGLPGMILEIAIPRLFTTWVATLLKLVQTDITLLNKPSEEPAIKKREFLNIIEETGSALPAEAKKTLWIYKF